MSLSIVGRYGEALRGVYFLVVVVAFAFFVAGACAELRLVGFSNSNLKMCCFVVRGYGIYRHLLSRKFGKQDELQKKLEEGTNVEEE